MFYNAPIKTSLFFRQSQEEITAIKMRSRSTLLIII